MKYQSKHLTTSAELSLSMQYLTYLLDHINQNNS